MINLRISAAVLALTAAGYAGSALAQQTAPATDPTAQTTQQAPPSSTTSPGVDPSTATPPPAPEADSAGASGTPSSATAPDSSTADPAAPAAKPEKKAKKHHRPAGAEATPDTSADAPK